MRNRTDEISDPIAPPEAKVGLANFLNCFGQNLLVLMKRLTQLVNRNRVHEQLLRLVRFDCCAFPVTWSVFL